MVGVKNEFSDIFLSMMRILLPPPFPLPSSLLFSPYCWYIDVYINICVCVVKAFVDCFAFVVFLLLLHVFVLVVVWLFTIVTDMVVHVMTVNDCGLLAGLLS